MILSLVFLLGCEIKSFICHDSMLTCRLFPLSLSPSFSFYLFFIVFPLFSLKMSLFSMEKRSPKISFYSNTNLLGFARQNCSNRFSYLFRIEAASAAHSKQADTFHSARHWFHSLKKSLEKIVFSLST